jgi:hypothetical protein
MKRVFSFIRIISLLFFLGGLLFVYAYLPENVSLYSDQLGTPIYFISKSQFFYYSFAFFLVVNLLLFVFGKMLDGVPVTEGRGLFSSEEFKNKTLIWLEVLISLINVFFVTGAAFIGVYNNRVNLDFNNFAYLVYLGTFLIFGWILSYGFVLRYRSYQPS